MNDLKISETAFIVNESRARRRDVSKDKYAEKWIIPRLRDYVSELWELFSEQVYPFDDIEVSVRNRYYLSLLKDFIKKYDNPLILNLGVGLTSYPFLIKDSAFYLEIDLPQMINYRKKRMNTLQDKKIIPKRQIESYGLNLNDLNDLDFLEDLLRKKFRISKRPSCIIMEGLSYYLKRNSLAQLLSLLKENQQKNSIISLDYWKPDILDHPVFNRLQTFFKEQFDFSYKNYTLFDKKFIKETTNYKFIKETSIMAEEVKYNKDPVLSKNRSNILPEYNFILQK